MKKIKLFLLLSFFVFLFSPCVFGFQDIQYDITAKFSPEKKTIEATEKLSFKNNSGQPLKEIYLRVYPNHRYSPKEKKQLYKYAAYFKTDPYPAGFDPGVFRINGIRLTGGQTLLTYAFEGEDQTVMKIVLFEPLKDGDTLNLDIEFSLKIPHRIGRFGWHLNTFALNRWYPLLAVFDAQGWHKEPDYLLHMPYISEAANYRLSLDVPQSYEVALGSDVTSQKEAAEGRKIVSSQSSNPLRELSLAISKDYFVYEAQYGGITVKSYYFKKDKAMAQKAAEFAIDLMKYYSHQFGEYPYKQFSIAPVYLGYGGSQNAGIIFLDLRNYQFPKFLIRYFDFLVAHETGHQWWYNVVGNNEFRQLWLDEGINSYWTLRYLQNKYGENATILEIPPWLEKIVPNPTFKSTRAYRYQFLAARGLDAPVISALSNFVEPSMIFSTAYGKGSVVIDMLAHDIGDEKFTEIMKNYFQKYKFQNVTADDFIKICQDESGKDLSWFFKAWLFGAGSCDYALSKNSAGLVLEKHGKIAMPVKTKLRFSDGSESVVSSDGTKDKEVIPLPEGKRLKSAQADYGGDVLDIDRLNNHYPREIDIKFMPVYDPLYEIAVFLREDAYSWITAPSFSEFGFGAKSTFQKPDEYIVYAASHYNPSNECFTHSAGFEDRHLFRQYLSWGFEFLNRDPQGDKETGLKSYKVFLRQELGFPYSMFDINSHATLYLIHNLNFGRGTFLGESEYARNLNYRQSQESIIGGTVYLTDAGVLPDPSLGYKVIATQEVAAHMMGANTSFTRTSLEYDRYFELIKGHKLALRFKGGVGQSDDKYLFYLGSDRELRGYGYKDIQGSSMLLGSAEYRFPMVGNIDMRSPCNIFSLDKLQGVLFFDTGSAWFQEFNEPGFKKDAGFGLRFYFNIAGSAEQVILRIDLARALSGSDRDTHLWVGVNQAF